MFRSSPPGGVVFRSPPGGVVFRSSPPGGVVCSDLHQDVLCVQILTRRCCVQISTRRCCVQISTRRCCVQILTRRCCVFRSSSTQSSCPPPVLFCPWTMRSLCAAATSASSRPTTSRGDTRLVGRVFYEGRVLQTPLVLGGRVCVRC